MDTIEQTNLKAILIEIQDRIRHIREKKQVLLKIYERSIKNLPIDNPYTQNANMVKYSELSSTYFTLQELLDNEEQFLIGLSNMAKGEYE